MDRSVHVKCAQYALAAVRSVSPDGGSGPGRHTDEVNLISLASSDEPMAQDDHSVATNYSEHADCRCGCSSAAKGDVEEDGSGTTPAPRSRGLSAPIPWVFSAVRHVNCATSTNPFTIGVIGRGVQCWTISDSDQLLIGTNWAPGGNDSSNGDGFPHAEAFDRPLHWSRTLWVRMQSPSIGSVVRMVVKTDERQSRRCR